MSAVDFIGRILDWVLVAAVVVGAFVWWRRSDYVASFKRARNSAHFKRTGKPHPDALPKSKAHGSAQWLMPDTAGGVGLCLDVRDYDKQRGLLLGQLIASPDDTGGGNIISYEGAGHMLVVAPTRAGKGSCLVVPNLLMGRAHCFVLDVKGENHAITAEERKEWGQVWRLAPDDAENSARYNPLDVVPAGAGSWEAAALIAEMLIVPSATAADGGFWEREARTLLAGVVQYVAATRVAGERTLAEVWRLLSASPQDFKNTLHEMAALPDEQGAPTARAFLNKADKEAASVLSTARGGVAAWENPKLQLVTGQSDFDLTGICAPLLHADLFLVVPPKLMTTYKPFVRLVVGQLLDAATSRKRAAGEPPAFFLLDEFPALGYMRPIVEGLGYLAGYGVRLVIFAQDVGQLRNLYQEQTQTIISNSAVRLFFGTNDAETARTVSDMMGAATVATVGTGYGDKGESQNIGETGRALLTPAEVMGLPPRRAVAFIQGAPSPAALALLPYYEDKELSRRAGAWDG